jgi:hypothetical protein
MPQNFPELLDDHFLFYFLTMTLVDSRSCRSSTTMLRANSFLLSMCSPVLQKMLCGSFMESSDRKLELKDVDGWAFGTTLDICCGKMNCAEMELAEMRELASVARTDFK